MKIKRTTSSTSSSHPPIRGKDTKIKIEQKHSPFLEELKSTTDEKTVAELDELLGKIDEQGKLLVQDTTLRNLLKYKDLVQEFMKQVMERLYRVKEVLGRRFVDQQKIYIIVEKVDKALDALTEEVLSSQANSLSIAAKLDDIRGMLIDLYR
jgi:hypothetical protein